MVKVQSNAYIEAELLEEIDAIVNLESTKWTSRSDFINEAAREKRDDVPESVREAAEEGDN